MTQEEFALACPNCGMVISAPTVLAQEKPQWDPEKEAFRVRIHTGPNDVEYQMHVAICEGPRSARPWRPGDRVAMRASGEGWLVMDAAAARSLGLDESSHGWIFSTVVADCDAPDTPTVQRPEDA